MAEVERLNIGGFNRLANSEAILKHGSDVARANKAQRIMNDPMVADAFELIDQAIIEGFRAAKPSDEAALVDLARIKEASAQFKRIFEKTIRDGVLSRHELALEKEGRFKKIKNSLLGRDRV